MNLHHVTLTTKTKPVWCPSIFSKERSTCEATTLARKIITAEIFMRMIRSAIMQYHAISTSICNTSSQCAATASRVDVELKLDIARYHMIKL